MKIIASLPDFTADAMSSTYRRQGSGAESEDGLFSGNWLAWPDSCLLPSDRPLYIPDFDSRFFAIPALALKSGRLGKGIASKFALRYFSGYSAALIILPQSAIRKLYDALLPGGQEICFDNSVVIGNLISIQPDMARYSADEALDRLAANVASAFDIEVSSTDIEVFSTDIEVSSTTRNCGDSSDSGNDRKFITGLSDTLNAAETLAAASATNTIKTGDFILSPLLHSDPIPLHEGMEIKISARADTAAGTLLRTRFK